ncbi:MAG: ABC transporter permease [Xenococcaceae cyanobacterium]
MTRSRLVNQKLSKVVYKPDSQLRNPVRLCQEMARDLLASRELAWQLMVRDISAQYRQSLLGICWAVIPPIITALGFTFANNTNIVNIGATDMPYPAYVMFSMTLWQTFVEALTSPIQAVTSAKQMLVKINFPREALILAKLGQIFFSFAIKLILIIALFLWYQIPVSWTAILAPVALIHLVILGTCFGLLLAPLGVLYNDILKGITYITGFWLFLTPVVYPLPNGGGLATLVQMNPVTPLLVTTRELTTTGVVSNPFGFWLVSFLAILGLLLGWLVYRLAMPFVVERISS